VTRSLTTALACVLAAAPAVPRAGEIPRAVLVLELAPGTPGSEPEGAPPRFVLLEDGQLFVGGSALVETGRLEKREARELEKRAEALRKNQSVGASVSFGGPSGSVARLRLLDRQPLEIAVSGWPAAGSVPAPLAELDALLHELASFHHASLQPYAPGAFAVRAREGRLAGGCRQWTFPFPIADAREGRRQVTPAEVAAWPTGAMPASVCAGDRRYVVTLRPLLPGEQP